MSKLTELLNYTKPTLNSVLGVKSKLEQLLNPSQPLGGGGGGSWGSNPEALAVSNKTALDRFMNPMIINQGITNKQVTEATPKTKLVVLAMAADMADPKIGAGVGLLSKIPGTGIVSDVAKSAVNGAKKLLGHSYFDNGVKIPGSKTIFDTPEIKARKVLEAMGVNPNLPGNKLVKHAEDILGVGKSKVAEYVSKLKPVDATSKSGIIKDMDIIKEVKKYKSAEEFVNSREIAYHVTPKSKSILIDKEGIKAPSGTRFRYGKEEPIPSDTFIWKDKKLAEEFAKLHPGSVIKEVDVTGLKLKKDPESFSEFVPGIEGNGYIHNGSIPAERIKTKSQLIDIWNKANKK